MSDELLISVLKEYVPTKDWDLHDWDTIISRREHYKDDIYIYPLLYADIYLDSELNYYSFEPKQPNYSFLEKKTFSDDDELIISVLKQYVQSKDYDLHDWETIISRREQYKNDIYIYKLVYADIYLDENLEFYDVEPKQPNMQSIKKVVDEDSVQIINALKQYIPSKYLGDVDWNVIISRSEKIKPNLTKYRVNNIDFYLDDELYPKEYGKVHIIDNMIFYDFELNPEIEYDGYIYFCDL